MRRNTHVFTAAVAMMLSVIVPRPTLAQNVTMEPPRAPRPLFGRPSTDGNTGESLDFTLSLGEAHDDNLLTPGASPVGQANQLFSTVVPAIQYQLHRNALQVGFNAGSNIRYYDQLQQLDVMNHSMGVGVSAVLSPRTTVFANQGFSYAPAYLYGLFGTLTTPTVGDIVPAGTDYATNVQHQPASYTYATAVGLTHNFTRRASFAFDSNIRYTDFAENTDGYSNLRAYDARGRFLYSLNRKVRLRVDYTFRQADYSSTLRQASDQNVNVGFDFNLSPGGRPRRTTFSFNVGPTAARDFASQQLGYGYLVNVDALVTRQIGRTWSVRGGWQRGVAYVDGLAQPVLANKIALQTTGYMNRRTELLVSGAYSAGDLSLTGRDSPITTYTGDARLRLALNSRMAADLEYLYYFYDFDQSFPLPVGVSHRLTRNGIRAGLTFWVPVMRHR